MAILLAACSANPASTDDPVTASLPASPSLAASETSSPTVSEPTSNASSSVDPAAEWVLAGSFSVDGALTYMSDVTTFDGGFAAIGHRWFNQSTAGDGLPLIWTSTDGRSWTEVAPDFGTTDVVLGGIEELPDGQLIVIGVIGRPGQAAEPMRAGAWSSADATAWTALNVPFNEVPYQDVGFVRGPTGYVAALGNAIWFSDDGLSWTRTYDAGEDAIQRVVAGDEGFVAQVSGFPRLLASGEGVDWFEADAPAPLGAAPLGGDWLGWGYTADPPTISLFRSADALQWSAVLDVNDLTGPDGPKAGLGMESGITEAALVGSSELAVMTLGWNHCCAQPSVGVGVFTSTDGEAWTAVELDDSAYVRGMATDGSVTVIVGHLGRGQIASVWVNE